MAATAAAAPELKRLAGVVARGRKLEKPVCHYSLSWARDEAPGWEALGLEKHQALIVAHSDGHTHVHVIVNRVDAESGKAAGLSKSKLRLSKWAEGYETGAGADPVLEEDRQQREARTRGAGEGPGLGLNGAAPAGEDEPAPGAAIAPPRAAGVSEREWVAKLRALALTPTGEQVRTIPADEWPDAFVIDV